MSLVMFFFFVFVQNKNSLRCPKGRKGELVPINGTKGCSFGILQVITVRVDT